MTARAASQAKITLSELQALLHPDEMGVWPSLRDLGKHFGATRQAVDQALDRYGLEKPRAQATGVAPRCQACGAALYHNRKRVGLCVKCKPLQKPRGRHRR